MMEDVKGAKAPLLPLSSKLANGRLLPGSRRPTEDDEEAGHHLTQADGRPRSRCARTGFLCAAIVLLVAAVAAAQFVALPLLCQRAEWGAGKYPQFLVVGDWGRQGDFNQSAVAAAMARKAAAMRTDFVISTGDNFYPSGLASPEDPTFAKSFIDVYSQPSLQVPWHAVLGNHDYGEADDPKHPDCGSWDRGCFYSPLHQLDVRVMARDPRWHCERSFRLGLAGGQVEIFFLDTTPLMREYEEAPWRGNRGGLLEQSWEGQLRELEAQLARSQAGWKLVVGHHPIRTNHREWHEFPEMVQHLEPLLVRYGVQAYFNGHDHNLQHLHKRSVGYHQICSGAGSRVGPEFRGHKHSPFQYGGNGFVAVRMGPDSMAVEYLGLDSPAPLFSIGIPRRIAH